MKTAPKNAYPKSATAEQIASHFSRLIRSNNLTEGDKLPPEQILAEEYGVSRPVVREALSRLKSDGLAESRQGSGHYVTALAKRNSFKIEDDEIADVESLLQLSELRQPLEMAVVRLAAARREDSDIENMRQAQASLRAARPGSPAIFEADQMFHHALAVATKNAYYAELSAFLSGRLVNAIHQIQNRGPVRDLKHSTIDEHELIIEAIRSKDPEAAAMRMLIHLESAKARVFEIEKERQKL